MAIGDGCSASDASIAWSNTIPVVTALTTDRVLNRAPTSPSLMAAAEYTSGGTLLSGYVQQVWLVSGPGPTYTREVMLAELTGVVALGTVSRGFWDLTKTMPVAGRLFDWTRDGFQSFNNAQFSNVSSASPMVLSYIACGSTSAVIDCCAELNEKLDRVLAAVARTWPVVPSV